jgi:integrase
MGFRTKKAAVAAHDKAKFDLRSGVYVPPENITLGVFLESEWMPLVERTLKPSTIAGYSGLIKRYISPELGRIRIDRLTASTINAFYSRLLHEGRTKKRSGDAEEDGPVGLSSATVCRVHSTLHKSMHDAVRWGLLTVSPMAGVDKPREKEGRAVPLTWTGGEVDAFLTSVLDDRLFAMWRLLATSGMRRSEMLGLQWGDIDFDSKWCSISRARVPVDGKVVVGTPKSENSRRCIGLDDETLDALRELKRPLLERSIAQGASWDAAAWVFTTKKGHPLDPAKVYRLFRKASDAAGLPRIRLHDLRHTVASLGLVGTGSDYKQVSMMLGHASVAFTMDTYAHVTPASRQAVAGVIAGMIRPDKKADVVIMLSNDA